MERKSEQIATQLIITGAHFEWTGRKFKEVIAKALETYANAKLDEAAQVADKYSTEYVFSFAQVAKEIRALKSPL